jgi:hypothetical protein
MIGDRLPWIVDPLFPKHVSGPRYDPFAAPRASVSDGSSPNWRK